MFAHHIAMLDAIEQELVESKTQYIRIDGSVSSVLRQEYVRKFQTEETCKVALLSECKDLVSLVSFGLNFGSSG